MKNSVTQGQFRSNCLRGFPTDLVIALRDRTQEIDYERNYRDGNGWLRQTAAEIRKGLGSASFELISSDIAIRDLAERLASTCRWCAQIEGMRRIAESHGIDPPDPNRHSRAGQYGRLTDPRWWRRKLRAHYGRVAEEILRARGLVRRSRSPYVSNFNLRRHRQQRDTLRYAIEQAVARDDEGTELPLVQVVDHSLANPKNRRAELMTRVSGLSTIATARGDTSEFFTLTAPSAFHPQLASGGPNPRYAGHSVRDTMRWLNTMWQRSRSALNRYGIVVYGLRVAEPHHDGTPHLHLLLFVSPENRERVRSILRQHWLSEFADEAGALQSRVVVKEIDPALGDPVGYVAKYVAKNIDGFRVDDDLEGQIPAADGAERVETWASTHRIRQFQEFGAPPIGIWRELRRLKGPLANPELELARSAADAGDYAAFIAALGGITARRKLGLRVWTEITGELSVYGEVCGPKVAGIECSGVRIRTRLHSWRIQWRKGTRPPQRPSAEGFRPSETTSANAIAPLVDTDRALISAPPLIATSAHTPQMTSKVSAPIPAHLNAFWAAVPGTSVEFLTLDPWQ